MRREDLETLCAFYNDLEFHLAGEDDPPMPHSLERMQAEFDANAGKDRPGGIAEFAIEAAGRLIGVCNVRWFDATARTCELGISIGDKTYWGKGYGREAVRLLLDYAFRLRNVGRVYLGTMASNERAIRCYRACGFVEEGRLREHVWSNGRYVDYVYMGILRDEWLAAQSDSLDRHSSL